MDPVFLVTAVILLVLLVIATCDDLIEHRIPNEVVVWGIVLALGIAALTGGLSAFVGALGGLVLGGALLLPLYMLGGMAAGDVKLMAMAGAFLGPSGAFLAVLITLVAGFVLASSVVAFYIGVRACLRIAASHDVLGRLPQRLQALANNRPSHVPYALAIAVGSATALWLPAA